MATKASGVASVEDLVKEALDNLAPDARAVQSVDVEPGHDNFNSGAGRTNRTATAEDILTKAGNIVVAGNFGQQLNTTVLEKLVDVAVELDSAEVSTLSVILWFCANVMVDIRKEGGQIPKNLGDLVNTCGSFIEVLLPSEETTAAKQCSDALWALGVFCGTNLAAKDVDITALVSKLDVSGSSHQHIPEIAHVVKRLLRLNAVQTINQFLRTKHLAKSVVANLSQRLGCGKLLAAVLSHATEETQLEALFNQFQIVPCLKEAFQ